MKNEKSNLVTVIILVNIVVGLLNIIMRRNLLILGQGLVVLLLIAIYIYINENRLFFFTFWIVMLSGTISEYIPQIEYSLYVCTILLIIKLLEKKLIKRQELKYDKLITILTISLLFTNIISLIYNGYPLNIILILFAAIKKFSFIILYIFYINGDMSDKSIKLNFKLMFVLALIQFPVLIIQYLMGTTADDISGTFGKSGTGVLLQYFINILILLYVINKECKKVKISNLVFAMMILVYCAIAEVKIGFIIVPLIYLFILISEGKYVKLVLKSIILIVSLTFIYSYFIKIYPEHDFINKLDFSKNYLETAYGTNAVNRSNYMPLLNKTILQSTYKRMLGTGLGTANPSSIAVLEGIIAKEYGHMNIHYFAMPYSVIENGIIGTIIWVGIYIYLLIKNIYIFIKQKKRSSAIVILICLSTLIFIYYNSSMITSNMIIMQVWFIISTVSSGRLEDSINK